MPFFPRPGPGCWDSDRRRDLRGDARCVVTRHARAHEQRRARDGSQRRGGRHVRGRDPPSVAVRRRRLAELAEVPAIHLRGRGFVSRERGCEDDALRDRRVRPRVLLPRARPVAHRHRGLRRDGAQTAGRVQRRCVPARSRRRRALARSRLSRRRVVVQIRSRTRHPQSSAAARALNSPVPHHRPLPSLYQPSTRGRARTRRRSTPRRSSSTSANRTS